MIAPSEDAFVAADTALDVLSEILLSFAQDFTPIILSHPPNRRSARIGAIKQSLSELEIQQQRLDALVTKLSYLQAGLTRRRALCASALAPISAMPSEILCGIFGHVVRSDNYISEVLTPIRLSLVCSSWRAIVSNHKHMWSSARLRTDLHMYSADLAIFLDRSKPLPFGLTVEDIPWWRKLFANCYGSARWPWLSELQQRLEYLSWNSSDDIGRFLESFERGSSFTSLHTLSIVQPDNCRSCQISKEDDRLDGRITRERVIPTSVSFPVLTELSLDNVSFSPPTSLIHTLKRLKISKTWLGPDDCRSILSQGLLIEVLEINDLAETQGTMDNDGHRMAYEMPNLRQIVFDYIPNDMVVYILNRCRAPNLQSLTVRDIGRTDEEPAAEGDAPSLPNLQIISSTLSQAILRMVRYLPHL